MSWVSKVSVNTSVVADAGWCLWLAQESVGASHLYPNARVAWDNVSDKHRDRDYQQDAVVALFWDWKSKTDGINYGHVVINVPGKGLFSSPKNWGEHGNAWYGSIDEVSAWLGASYLGWGTDLSGLKLSEWVDPKPSKAEIAAARRSAKEATKEAAKQKKIRIVARRSARKAAKQDKI